MSINLKRVVIRHALVEFSTLTRNGVEDTHVYVDFIRNGADELDDDAFEERGFGLTISDLSDFVMEIANTAKCGWRYRLHLMVI